MRYLITETRIHDFIYEYLEKNYPPDYGWMSHNYYENYVKRWGNHEFYLNDNVAYVYVGRNRDFDILNEKESLIVWNKASDELTKRFGDLWKPVMAKWFEDNTGLQVKHLDAL